MDGNISESCDARAQNLITEKKIRKTKCEYHRTMTYIFYCKTCECLICSDCFDYGHSYDATIDIDQYVAQYPTAVASGTPSTARRASLADSGTFDHELSSDAPSPAPLVDSGTFGNSSDGFLADYGAIDRNGNIEHDTCSSVPTSEFSQTKSSSDQSCCFGDGLLSTDHQDSRMTQQKTKSAPERSESHDSTLSTTSNSSYVLVDRSNSFFEEGESFTFSKTNTYSLNTSISSINALEFHDDREVIVAIRGGDIRKIMLKKKFNFLSNKLKSSTIVQGLDAAALVITSEGNILLVDSAMKAIYLITETHANHPHVAELYTFHDVEPVSVHLNKESHVFWVGLVRPNMNWEDEGHLGSGSIATMFLSGNVVNHFTRSRIKLFTRPTVIKELDNMLYAIDQQAQNKARVVAVNLETEGLKWTYSHRPTYGSFCAFLPIDLSVSQCIIVVLDASNLEINLLDLLGSLIMTKPLRDFEIEKPIYISSDYLFTNLWIVSESRLSKSTTNLTKFVVQEL